MSRKKQQEIAMKSLREFLSQPANKKCLECDQRGPTYVDITIGSFVCTSCGGLLRGLNPPHRIKSISMTNFTGAEIKFIESRGNEWCRAVYLAKYDDESGAKPSSKSDTNKLKTFMEMKYEQKRWYESPTHQRKLMENAVANARRAKSAEKPAAVALPKQTKIAVAPVKKPTTNLLDGLSFPAPSQPVASNTSQTSNEFADFDKAFAMLSTSQTVTTNQQDPFAAFQVSSKPIDFTNTTPTQPAVSLMSSSTAAPQSQGDKYAALADLDLQFHKVETPPTNDSLFGLASNSTNAAPSQPTNMAAFVGMLPQPTTTSLFATNNALPAYNHTMPDTSSSAAFGVAPSWNASFGSVPAYQQPNPAPVASVTNPFFSNTQPAVTPMQNWATQMPQTNAMPATMNSYSSTNPFNMAAPVNPPNGSFNMSQMSNPRQNSSNPFLFS